MAGATPSISGVHLWLVLMRAHRSLQRHAERSIVEFGLGLSDFAILELILHKGSQKVSEIGRRVNLTSGSITSAIDRLEAAGLVDRSFDGLDRRSRIVELTARGRARIAEAFEVHATAMEGAAAGLTKAQRGVLVPLLKKLGAYAEERSGDDTDGD
jgi:MarR family 2-MHQ and catechol resistance regulon transcriptional repressor